MPKLNDKPAKADEKLTKDQFKLVQLEEVLYDQKFESEPVGYFKDAWMRFRRNKVSVIAFIILMFLFSMAVIGPHLNKFGFEDHDIRVNHLPPRVPGLERLGIFDGTKVIIRSDEAMSDPRIPEGTIIEVLEEEETVICRGSWAEFDGVEFCQLYGQPIDLDYYYTLHVRVDYYMWRNYRNMYGHKFVDPDLYPERAQEIIDTDPIFMIYNTDEQKMDRYREEMLRDPALRTLTSAQYDRVMKDNPTAIVEVVQEIEAVVLRFEVIDALGEEHTITIIESRWNRIRNLFSGETQFYPEEDEENPGFKDVVINRLLEEGVSLVNAQIFIEYIERFAEDLATEEQELVYRQDNMLTFSNGHEVLERALLNMRERDDTMYRVRVDHFNFMGYEEGEIPYFWFGTDNSGKDLFSLIWLGARISFFVSFLVAFINITIGIIMGAICGYYGGNVDLVLQRIFEIISSVPFLAIITLLVLRFGSTFWVVILAFTFSEWIGVSRIVRAQFYRYKNREYVLAARSLGASDFRIMSRHILPNAIGTIITSTVLIIPAVIFTESTFSFLGIINYGNMTSVGNLIATGQTHMRQSFHLLLFPAIFISLLMLSFNMFGNGLRDALNPSLRGVDE